MLGQDVETAGPLAGSPSKVPARKTVEGGAALENLETVCRHQQSSARPIESMVRTADALQQARNAFGRANLDDQVHGGPIDAKVEGGGRDHGAQLAAGHGRFDLSSLLRGREAAVVQRDGQAVLVEPPQLAEHDLGLGTGIDEDQGRGRCTDPLVNLGKRMDGHVARPRQVFAGHQDIDLGRGATACPDQPDRGVLVAPGGREPGGQRPVVVNRGRKADAPALRRQRLQARETQRQ